MINILGSIIMITGGICLILFSFYDNRKKTITLVTKDSNEVNKYLKYKICIDIMAGFCFIILGAVSILNIYNGDLIWVFSYIILLLDNIIAFRINKKINTYSSYKPD